jgi:zinc D-Ala-D-Ala carboxypeptidase
MEARSPKKKFELLHFKPHEFQCKCGKCGQGFEQMDPGLLMMLDSARQNAGIAFKLNSAVRCEAHNKAVGGSDTSAHLKGLAVDISCKRGPARFLMLLELIRAGFNRIGLGADFIHVDIDKNKPPKTAWLY